MSDPWTAAWEEAEATVPASVILYCTLELRHPSFGATTPIRCVAGSAEDMHFTLEDDAPVGGGTSVLFQAIPFSADMPQWEEGKTPEIEITVDNVARELMPYLEEAVTERADLECSYREYRSDDLTAPCYGPVTFLMKRVTATRTSVKGMARIDDLSNRKFPNKFYTISEFPGLQP